MMNGKSASAATLSEGSMALLIKPPASSEGLATPALLKA